MATNADVIAILNNTADLLEIKGENRFRVNAYRDAARSIEAQAVDLAAYAREGRLRELSGVGEAIASKIDEFLKTGQIGFYERLRSELPETLLELRAISGLGPKKIQALYQQLGVRSLADLREAAQAGRLATLAGFGGKTEQNVLRELERYHERGRRVPLGVALPLMEELTTQLQAACAAVERISPAGSIRRRRSTVGDLDLLAASADPSAVLDAFVKLPLVQEVVGRGDTKASVLTRVGREVDLRVVPPDSWGAAMQYFTGSKAHNVRVRELALRHGWTLNEYALTEKATGKRVAGADEDEIYALLGLQAVPPELREDTGEVEAALAGQLPPLLTREDVRGDLHSHSDWSDGSARIEVMVEAARAQGHEYLALTDHSQSLGVARGLTVERVLEQRAIVRELNEWLYPFRILHGIELEIRADGALDFPDEVLAEFDLVIASVHSSFSQPREKMTARLVGAARNPHVDLIGHPSGRLLGTREPYDVDLDALIAACAESGTAIEINSNPARLDLDDVHVRRAREQGVWIAVNTDAHAPDHFGYLPYGVDVARRGWLERRHVLNALGLDELLAWLRRRG